MEAWIPTTDVNIAAVIATMGATIKVETSTDVRKGTGWTNIEFPAAQVPTVKVPSAPGTGKKLIEKSIIALLKSGELGKYDPHHFALDGVHALHNRERILDWLKTGKSHTLARITRTARSIYVLGEIPPAVQVAAEVFPTNNIKLAAALGIIGAHITKIVGDQHHHTFYVSRWTEPLEGKPLDAHALSRELFANELDKQHPLYWAFQCLKNRERILDLIHKKDPALLVRRLGSPNYASSIIHQTGDKKALEKGLSLARKHSGIF